jgi:hypothetical protein
MKGFLAAFEAAIAVALAIVAVHRLSNPIPAGNRFIARATMRAVALPVNDAVDVAGFALPAMHVDVIISGTPPSGTGGLGTRTRTLLQNIEVLSAGRYFEKGAEGKPELRDQARSCLANLPFRVIVETPGYRGRPGKFPGSAREAFPFPLTASCQKPCGFCTSHHETATPMDAPAATARSGEGFCTPELNTVRAVPVLIPRTVAI